MTRESIYHAILNSFKRNDHIQSTGDISDYIDRSVTFTRGRLYEMEDENLVTGWEVGNYWAWTVGKPLFVNPGEEKIREKADSLTNKNNR